MKVLHVIPLLTIRRGGEPRACAELCESLARLGIEVTLAHLRDSEGEEFQPEGVALCACERAAGPLGTPWGYSPELRAALKELVPKSDLVHIHGVWRYTGIAAARQALRSCVPYVIQPHGSLSPWKLGYKRLRKWVHGALFERKILRNARTILAASEAEKEDILQYVPGADVSVVPYGAYPAKLTAPISMSTAGERWPALKGFRVILYLGRLDVNKGVDLLIRAFRLAGATQSEWRLLLIGPDFGGTQARMEDLAHKTGIADRLVWAGWVSEEEKRLALRSCDFYVLPSLAENFGISVLEALLCGRPVITTTETPWNILNEIGAGVTVAPAVKSLAEVLRQWMTLPKAKLDEIGERGHHFAIAQFDWAVVAAKFRHLYTEILSFPSS